MVRKPPACGADRKPSESLVGWCSSQEAGSTFERKRGRERERTTRGSSLFGKRGRVEPGIPAGWLMVGGIKKWTKSPTD